MTKIDQPDTPFTLMVADRSSHIRNFLKRELATIGYSVRIAETGSEIAKWVYHPSPLDLLIMDVDLPDISAFELLTVMSNRIPALPVVLHSYFSEEVQEMMQFDNVFFVEKRGNSLDRLKQLIERILKKSNASAESEVSGEDPARI